MRADIQALRAIAVLAVVVFHMHPAWLPGGYLGVDVFFSISGFVITRILLKQPQRIDLLKFWSRRIFRIVPAYAVMLSVVVAATALVFLPDNFGQFLASWRQAALFLSNQYFAGYGDYFSPALAEQPLLHTWSLAIEMQFYLVYPLLFWAVLRSGRPWLMAVLTLAGLLAAQWLWIQAGSKTAGLYYSLGLRIPEFLLGCSLAFYETRLQRAVQPRTGLLLALAGLGLLAACLVWIHEAAFTPLHAALACLGACLVMAAGVSQGRLGAVFASRGVLLVGALSYSLYLWHWPLLALMRYALGTLDWTVPLVAGYAAAAWALSWLSWTVVERHFKSVPSLPRPSAWRRGVLLAVLGVSPFAFAKPLNASVPPLPLELTRYAPPTSICHGRMLPTCVRGTGPVRYLLIGDSHAAQLNLAVQEASRTLHQAFEVISGSSCVPLAGFDVRKLPAWAQGECSSQIAAAAPRLESAQAIVLAGMWSYQFEDPGFPAVLDAFLAAAQQRGQQVWVLGQVPMFTRNPRRLYRLQALGLDLPLEREQGWRAANDRLRAQLRGFPAVRYVDPEGFAFLRQAPVFEGQPVYSDAHHLNEPGARLYGDNLAAILGRAASRD